MARRSSRNSGRTGSSRTSRPARRSVGTPASGRNVPASRSGRCSDRRTDSRAEGRGRSAGKPPGSGVPGGVIIGGGVAAVALVIVLAVTFGGSSSSGASRRRAGRSRKSRKSSTPAAKLRMSVEEATRLKAKGAEELRLGEALVRRAGAFASSDYANRMREAKPHLEKARDLFFKAQEGLPHDAGLDGLLVKCMRLLKSCFFVPVGSH